MAAAAATTTAPPAPTPGRRRRIGVVGYGSLGAYLVERVTNTAAGAAALEIAFVWNRSAAKLATLPPTIPGCTDLRAALDGAYGHIDLWVEVCHPDITVEWGAAFLAAGDYYIGSPTALADDGLRASLSSVASASSHTLYVPTGALWGAEDIRRMADRGSLGTLRVTMAKHPASLKLEGGLGDALAAHVAELAAAGHAATDIVPGARRVTLYDGPVAGLCPLAPNNVNTMAAAAIAGHTLSFPGVTAALYADASLAAHVVTVEAVGKPAADGSALRVFTERTNPAPPGAVTGSATFASFFSSLLAAAGKPPGLHLC